MNDPSNIFEFEIIKRYTKTNALGELRLEQGDKVTLIDEDSVFLKVQYKGRIGFAPLSHLNSHINCEDSKKCYLLVHHQHTPEKDDEMEIDVGQLVTVKAVCDDGWCYGKTKDNIGWIPCNHLTPLFNSILIILT